MMPSDGKISAVYQRLKDTAHARDLELTVADGAIFCVGHRDQKNALSDPEEFRTLAEIDAFLRGFDHGHRPRQKLKLYSTD